MSAQHVHLYVYDLPNFAWHILKKWHDFTKMLKFPVKFRYSIANEAGRWYNNFSAVKRSEFDVRSRLQWH